jgi:hypothetical protein
VTAGVQLEKLARRWVPGGLVGAVLAICAWSVTLYGTAAACSLENTPCGTSHDLHTWQGRVFNDAGRPARHALIDFSEGYAQASVFTDARGRFCVRAVDEKTGVPFVGVSQYAYGTRLGVRPGTPVYPRFRDPQLRKSLVRKSGYAKARDISFMTLPGQSIGPIGSVDASSLWISAKDGRASCQNVASGLRWYQWRGSTWSWQVLVVTVAGLATLALAAVAVTARVSAMRRGSSRKAAASVRAGKAAFVGGIAAAILAFALFVFA